MLNTKILTYFVLLINFVYVEKYLFSICILLLLVLTIVDKYIEDEVYFSICVVIVLCASLSTYYYKDIVVSILFLILTIVVFLLKVRTIKHNKERGQYI